MLDLFSLQANKRGVFPQLATPAEGIPSPPVTPEPNFWPDFCPWPCPGPEAWNLLTKPSCEVGLPGMRVCQCGHRTAPSPPRAEEAELGACPEGNSDAVNGGHSWGRVVATLVRTQAATWPADPPIPQLPDCILTVSSFQVPSFCDLTS